MIAVDPLEQLRAEAFELIAADACRGRAAGRVEIAFEERVGERPHGQPRHRDMLVKNLAVAQHRPCRMQRMGLAAQRAQLLPRGGAVGRLGKAFLAQRQSLIGAEHDAALPPHRDGARLLAGEQLSNVAGIGEAGFHLDAALVDIGDVDLNRDAGGFEHRAAHRALGGEDQRLTRAP